MANTSALLLNLLTTNADINYYTQQQIYWSNKYEANYAKLSKQVKYEEQWNDAYDKAMAAENDIKIKGRTYVNKGDYDNCTQAQKYANDLVDEYNEELSESLAELDIEYDTMKCMYDTLLEELRAQQESEKTATSTAAQDTGLLNQ